jgi:hypothetical protein
MFTVNLSHVPLTNASISQLNNKVFMYAAVCGHNAKSLSIANLSHNTYFGNISFVYQTLSELIE